RHTVPLTHHSRVLELVLLGISRQSAGRDWLPLKPMACRRKHRKQSPDRWSSAGPKGDLPIVPPNGHRASAFCTRLLELLGDVAHLFEGKADLRNCGGNVG